MQLSLAIRAVRDKLTTHLEHDLRSMESPAQSQSPFEASAREPERGQQSDERLYGWSHLVALVILLGVFLAMIAANIGGTPTDGVPRVRADIKALETNIIRYKHLTKNMPESLRDLAFRPTNFSGPWRKLIEDSFLRDQWGNDFRFRNPGRRNPMGYDVFSVGPDGQEDTEDDVGNWQN